MGQKPAILNWRKRRQMVCHSLALTVLLCTSLSAQIAVTFGSSVTRLTGLNAPYGTAVDKSGNIFVADTGNNQIKEFLVSESYATAHILGGSFAFSSPRGVAVDSSGNVFVADWGVSTIREILAAGGYATVSSLPSEGLNHPFGVVVDSSDNLFITDQYNNRVKELTAVSNYSSAAQLTLSIGTTFSAPSGITMDSAGNLFVTSSGDGAVYELLAPGFYETVNRIASGFTFSNPEGIAVDSNGNLFVAEAGNNRVDEILAAGGSVSQVASGLSSPYGVAVDSHNNLFISDTSNNAIKEIYAVAAQFSSVAVGASATQTLTVTITAAGTLYPPTVLTQSAYGTEFFDAGTGTCAPHGTSHTFNLGDTCTVDVTFTPATPGLRMGVVQMYGSGISGVIASANLSGTGTAPLLAFNTVTGTVLGSGGYQIPYGTAIDSSGNVYVADSGGTAVVKIPATCISGANSSSCVTTMGAGLSAPKGVAVDGSANVYVADTGNNAIKKIPPGCRSSSCTVTLGTAAQSPQGIALDGIGNVYFSAANAPTVTVIPAGCSSSSCWASMGGGFQNVIGVAVDAGGNVYAADASSTPGVYKIPTYCSAQSCVQSLGGSFSAPTGIGVDAAGDVYVTDASVSYLILIPPGCASYTCETFLASYPTVSSPTAIALDGLGNLYVADGRTKLVTEFQRTSASLTFPTVTRAGTTDSTDGAVGTTVDNIGNATLTFPAPTVSGSTNPSVAANFAYVPYSCTQSSTGYPALKLAPSATCDIALQFAPTTPGIISGSVTLTDNSLNTIAPGYTTHTVALKALSDSVINHLAISVPPASPNAGDSFNVTVTAYSDSGNTVATNYVGPIEFLSSDGRAVLPGVSVLTGGVGTFPVTLKTVGSQTVTVADASGSPSVTSSGISVTQLDHVTMTGYPSSTTAGTSFTVHVTAYSDATHIATSYSGPLAFHSTDTAAVFPSGTLSLTAGQGSFSITLDTAGTQTLTVGDASGSPTITSSSITVNTAAVSQVIATAGSGQHAIIDIRFTIALTVKTADAYGNPVGGILVTFSVPTTGPSAVLSSTSCTTGTTRNTGVCSVTGVANYTASPLPTMDNPATYNVSAAAAGLTTANFSLYNDQGYVIFTSITPQQTATVYGQPVTVNTVFSPSTLGAIALTGLVTYYDGTTALTPNQALTPSQALTTSTATYTGFPVVGNHTYSAMYLGNETFQPSITLAATNAVAVTQASSTIIGSSSPVAVYTGLTGSLPVNVAGQYSGAGILPPSGSVSYTVSGNAFPAGTATINAGVATIPVPNTLATGMYTVTISYGGDGNYTAATSITQTLNVALQNPSQQTTGTTGTTLVTNLMPTGSGTIGSIVVTGSGSTAYTVVAGGTCAVNASVTTGAVCTLNYKFTATDPGLLVGTVTLYDTSIPAHVIGVVQLATLRFR